MIILTVQKKSLDENVWALVQILWKTTDNMILYAILLGMCALRKTYNTQLTAFCRILNVYGKPT